MSTSTQARAAREKSRTRQTQPAKKVVKGTKSNGAARGAGMETAAGQRRGKSTGAQLKLFAAELVAKASGAETITRERIEVELGIVEAETWPARYKVHKYWGRKPANVVARHIEFFSEPGETVLDPFAGSGVTVVEGARLGRTSIGFDLNPFASRLAGAMLSPPAPEAFQKAAKSVIEKADEAVAHLFRVRCDQCGAAATLRSTGYVGSDAREVRYWCPVCKHTGARSPTKADLALASASVDAPPGSPDEEMFFGWEMQKLKRRGVRRWRDLFTARNFAAAAHLRRAILEVKDTKCREWLLISLTASLANFTKMIADFSGDAGGPSWKINCYWLPDKWQELNPLWYFDNRVSKSLDAIHDLIAAGAPFPSGTARLGDSRTLPLGDGSVDYVFTDPPYGGEGIQYGELSMLWCLWLGEQEALSSEVAFNPHRKLDQNHYADGLKRVFAECYRVLKPGRWMTVTFANKDPQVWDALMNACRSAGFDLVTAAPMKRSAPSLTETTMHTAPKADLVLNFVKPSRAQARRASRSDATYHLDDAVRRIADALRRTGREVDAHSVFDMVTVDWFSWFYENGDRPEVVQPDLARVEAALRGGEQQRISRRAGS